jgi:hypothetical protein
VLGTSYWVADFHLPALRSHAGARVRAICGRDRRRAQALAEQHDVPEVYTDYRAMIDSSELDALVVVMPEDLHHPMVMAGVERPSEPSEPPWVSPQGQNSACFEDVVERGLGRHSHLREAGLEQDPV